MTGAGRRRSQALVALAAVVAVAAGCATVPRAVSTTTSASPVTPPTVSATSASRVVTTVPATSHVPASTTVTLARSPTSGPTPSPLPPLAPPPSPGTWVPAGPQVAGGYAIYTTELRPAAGTPPAGIAWIESATTRLVLFAGVGEPLGTWPDQGSVGPDLQPDLLAAFNGGFQIRPYRTGWFDQGATAMPLQVGAASLVISADGSATVGQWGRDVIPGPQVMAVRQNLRLLVDRGAPVADATVAADWGAVFGGGSATWRSGVGVTATGDLVYVGGPALTPLALASVLVAAGTVRAMELDINPQWVSFSTFRHDGGAVPGALTGGDDLLPGMALPPGHYLRPFVRDFFAVLAR